MEIGNCFALACWFQWVLNRNILNMSIFLVKCWFQWVFIWSPLEYCLVLVFHKLSIYQGNIGVCNFFSLVIVFVAFQGLMGVDLDILII